MNKIYINELNLHEDDIKTCSCQNTLNNYKIDILKLNSCVKHKIAQIKEKKGTEEDIKLLRKTVAFKNILSILIDMIKARQTEVKKNKHIERREILIEKLREYVGEEVFLKMTGEVNSLHKQQ